MTTITTTSGFQGALDNLPVLADFDLFPSASLVALYEFGQGAGTTLLDTSGNGNHGKITAGAGAWVAEGTGSSWQFGAGSYIDLPFGVSGDLTVAVVCKPNFTSAAAFRTLVSNMTDDNRGASLCYYAQAGGGTSVVWGGTGGLATKTIAPPDVDFVEPWRLEVLSLGAGGAATLANMTAGGSNNFAAAAYSPSDTPLCIGAPRSHAPISAMGPFDGKIAMVAVWARQVSATPSATMPFGPSEFQKIKTFANADVLLGRGISV